MNYVAIDTSGKNLTLIVCKGGVITSFHDSECGVNHSVKVMPKLEEMIKQAELELSEVDFFACVVGAGSFTGIRIGVATVKALCFAFNKPCLSITSFDTLAYNKKSGKVMAIIDAKHNGFYVCGYENGKVVYQPAYIMREELLGLKTDYQFVSSEAIDGLDCEVVEIDKGLQLAIQNKKELVSYDYESLIPLYVRKSQAEEGR